MSGNRPRILGIPPVRRNLDQAPTDNGEEKTAWDIYNKHAGEIEREKIQDWNDMLNTLLVFAALYSAILTAFIIESMKLIQEDNSETTKNILLSISKQLNDTSAPFYDETAHEFVAPLWALRVNYCFFVSLACSLVTALASVLALQWVGSYDHGLNPSSVEGRALQRRFRIHGAQHWKLEHVIAFMPTIIFMSLLVFMAGLGLWLWNVHFLVAIVVIAGAALGTLFFGFTTIISIFNIAAPFRTPVSRYLPFWIQFLAKPAIKCIRGASSPLSKFSKYLKDSFGHQQQTSREGTTPVASTTAIGPAFLNKVKKVWFSLWKPLQKSISFLDVTKSIETRERLAIDSERDFLIPSSLFWLADSIDIEPYQHKNIVVVVQAILDLPRWQRPRGKVDPDIWTLIFNELHAPLIGKTHWTNHLPEELEHAVLFVQCLTSIGSVVFEEDNFRSLASTFYGGYREVQRISNMLVSWRCLELNSMEREKREQSQTLTFAATESTEVDDLQLHVPVEMENETILQIYQQVIQYWFELPLEFVIMALESIQKEPKLLESKHAAVFDPIASHLLIDYHKSNNENTMPLQTLDILQGIITSKLSTPPLPRLDLESYLNVLCQYLGLCHDESGKVIPYEHPSVKEYDTKGAMLAHIVIVQQTIARLALFRASISDGPRIQGIIHRIYQLVQPPLWKHISDYQPLLSQSIIKSLADTSVDIWEEKNRLDTAKIISIALNLNGDFSSGNWTIWWIEFILGLQKYINTEDYDKEIQAIVFKLGQKTLSAGLLDGTSFVPDQITRLRGLSDPHVRLLAAVAAQSTELVRPLLLDPDGDDLVPKWKALLLDLDGDDFVSKWKEFIEFSYNYLNEKGSVKPSFLAVFTIGCSLDMYDRMYRERITFFLKLPPQLLHYLAGPTLVAILRHAEARPEISTEILESVSQLEDFASEFSKADGFESLPKLIRKHPLYLEEVLNIIRLALTGNSTNAYAIKWLETTHQCLLETGKATHEDSRFWIWHLAKRNAGLLKGVLQKRNKKELHPPEIESSNPQQVDPDPAVAEDSKIVLKTMPKVMKDKEMEDKKLEGIAEEWTSEEKEVWDRLFEKVMGGLEKGYIGDDSTADSKDHE